MTRSRETGDVGHKAYKKNYLINGGMDVWQRDTSGQELAGAFIYAADRWCFGRGGSGINARADAISSSFTGQYMRLRRESGDATTDWLGVHQRLETINTKALFRDGAVDSKLTLSFRVAAGSEFSAVNSEILVSLNTTSADDTTAIVANNGRLSTGNPDYVAQEVAVPITTASTTYSVTFDLFGSIANLINVAEIGIRWEPTGTTVSSLDRVSIYEVQLESGSVATPFEYVSAGDNLAACQRYYETSFDPDNPSLYSDGASFSTALPYFRLASFAVQKRIIPTFTYPTSDAAFAGTTHLSTTGAYMVWATDGARNWTWAADAEL